MESGDPRFQPLAYLTDGRSIKEGRRLFEVISQREYPVGMGPAKYYRLIIEDCATFKQREITIGAIRRDYTLVKETPKAVCPDLPADLVVVVDARQDRAAKDRPADLSRAPARSSRSDRSPAGPA